MSLFEKMKKPTIDTTARIADARFVVVDTELTGLDEKKDSIVSIGAVRMTGTRIELGDTFYRLVSPRTELRSDSVVIHEITPSEVLAQPRIDVVLDEFLQFCGDAVLAGHFISIDLSFLNREQRRIRGNEIPNPAIDTFSIYEWLRKRDRSRDCFVTPFVGYRLYDIVKCFDIAVNGAHNALMDAFTTAQLLQQLLPMLIQEGAQDIGDLLNIGIPFKGGDQFRLSGEFSNF